MNKTDLKTGMLVETRDGNRYIIVDRAVLGLDYWRLLDDYNDDLTHSADEEIIDKVGYYDNAIYHNCNVASLNFILDMFVEIKYLWERPMEKISKDKANKILKKLGYELE